MRILPLLCLALPLVSVPVSGIAGPADGARAAAGTKAPGFAAVEACPFDKLKVAYDAAMTGADTLDVFAIDKEILTVCNERTALITKLLKGDRELAKLLAPPKPGTSAAAGSKKTAPQAAPSKSTASVAQARRPVALTAAPAAGKPSMAGLPAAGIVSKSNNLTAQSTAPAGCTAKYAMISLAAVPGQRHYTIGGVVDQATGATYTVTAGDTLPGFYTVQSVDGQGITLRHGTLTERLAPNTKTFPVRGSDGFYAEPVTGHRSAAIPGPATQGAATPPKQGAAPSLLPKH